MSSAVASATALYSASVLDRATVRCLRELHEIMLRPRKTRYAPVERQSRGELAQSVSLKTSRARLDCDE